MAPNKKADPNNKLVAENRRARYDYAIEDTVECGMMLMGSEVKSLRDGSAHITESYAAIEDGELWLHHIWFINITQIDKNPPAHCGGKLRWRQSAKLRRCGKGSGAKA